MPKAAVSKHLAANVSLAGLPEVFSAYHRGGHLMTPSTSNVDGDFYCDFRPYYQLLSHMWNFVFTKSAIKRMATPVAVATLH